MSTDPSSALSTDVAPGEESDSFLPGLTTYVIGLVLSTGLQMFEPRADFLCAFTRPAHASAASRGACSSAMR